jgi:serine/threonine-protein kinase
MQLGQYQVWEEIGRGGMGVVYRGYDPLIGREVALKTIHLYAIADPRERQEMQERLQREAQSAGRLSHPNIVTIYQIGYAELQPGQTTAFLAMEFVPGPNLSALLETLRSGPPETIIAYLKQAAAALDYAHSRGVIHRDIKPANLLVTPEGVLKIADFGVAKIVTQTVTMTGTVLGSPAYMSPEQIKAEKIDGRTDQYSLAVVAYELFSGRKPFEAETLSSLVYKIAQQPPPPLETVPPQLAGRVGPVLLRALAKEPETRYPSCMAFVEALEASLRAPVHAAARPAAPPKVEIPRTPPLKPGPAVRVSPRVLGAAGAVCAGIALIGWMAVALREPAPKAQLTAVADSGIAVANPAEPAAAPEQKTAAAGPAARQPSAEPAAMRAPAAPQAVLASKPSAAVQTASSAPLAMAPAKPAPAGAGNPAGGVQKAPPIPSAKTETPAQAQPLPSAPEPKPEAQKTAAVQPEPEPPAPAPAREPVRTPPRAVQTAPAAYTPEALQQGIEGSVLLSVDIDEQGVPRRARVLRSLEPGLDRKAIESLAGWRFSPATEDGKAVPSTANVEVNFQLVGAPRRTPPSLKSLKK